MFVIALLITTLILTLGSDNDNVVYQTEPEEKEVNQVGGFLTLMLETEAGSGQYQESTSSLWPGDGYVFNSELYSCQNGSELSWNEELGAVTLTTIIADACYVYFDVYNPPTLAEWVISQYTGTDGDNGLYYHDADLANGAADNSYRYAGANPNNYVCFGSATATCSSDNLYRIIGVFNNEVKLIKNTSYGNYVWESDYSGQSNAWNPYTKTYPDIRTTLNSTFLNTISRWQDKISNHAFKVGGISSSNGKSTPRTAYNYEVGSSSSSTIDSMKIGLMYVSDYGYSASPSYWTTNLSSYSSTASSNWMYLDSNEWTISRISDGPLIVFGLNSGRIYSWDVNNSLIATRPCFYLNSDVEYSSGSGTQSDPIRIEDSDSSGPTDLGVPSTGDAIGIMVYNKMKSIGIVY